MGCIPGDPRNCDELVFWITPKVVKIEPSYWMEKMQNFIRIISISMIWKSDHWSLHHVFISKSGQNAKQSGISLFFKLYLRLTIWKCPYNDQNEWLKPQRDTSYERHWIMECIYITYVGFSRPWVMGSSQKRPKVTENHHFDDLWPFQMTAK